METALVLMASEADPLIQEYRSALSLPVQEGIGAHITLLYPFLPADEVTDEDLRTVQEILSDFEPFTYSLDAVAYFDEIVLYLAPSESQRFSAMTHALTTAYPQYPPYGGQFTEIVPHVTVGNDVPAERLRDAEEALAALLPLNATARDVVMMQGTPGSPWVTRHSFNLGTRELLLQSGMEWTR